MWADCTEKIEEGRIPKEIVCYKLTRRRVDRTRATWVNPFVRTDERINPLKKFVLLLYFLFIPKALRVCFVYMVDNNTWRLSDQRVRGYRKTRWKMYVRHSFSHFHYVTIKCSKRKRNLSASLCIMKQPLQFVAEGKDIWEEGGTLAGHNITGAGYIWQLCLILG